MTADAWGVVATLCIALFGGGWALWKWHTERRDDIKQEHQRVDALYVNPLMFAAQDLQSRLYNLLDGEGLVPLRKRDVHGRYAMETLFLVARYFAYEIQMLRFTNLGTNVKVLQLAQAVREALATDQKGTDAWCIFRTTQNALAQSVIEWRQGEVGFADTTSFVEFDDLMEKELAALLGLEGALDALRKAEVIEDLGTDSCERLGEVQSRLVDLLEAVEARCITESGGSFSLSPEHRRNYSKYSTRTRSTDQVSPAAPQTNPRR